MSEWFAIEPRDNGWDRRIRYTRDGTRVTQNVRGWKGRLAVKVDGKWSGKIDECFGHVHNKRSAARECAAREARARNRKDSHEDL